MYAATDPRAALNKDLPKKPPTPIAFQGATYARFYETEPTEVEGGAKTWYTRGQNLVIACTSGPAGTTLSRKGQPDEYVLLTLEQDVPVTVTANGETVEVPGYSIVMIPPGDSTVTLKGSGTVYRMFTTRSPDLVGKCANAGDYAKDDPNVPPFQAWPEPVGGFKIRPYSLDVPDTPGRFGKLFRCTTVMVNCFAVSGPRDITKLSPHHHDDFEQYSLAATGSFTHHLRWPWTPDSTIWREDEHELCASPSVCVIPPPSIHTSRAMEPANRLIDIFGPPRRDFSEKPGWVLNAADYPMP